MDNIKFKPSKSVLKKWVTKNWGKRCEGFCPHCGLCEAWKAYDYLTLNEVTQPKCCESCFVDEAIQSVNPVTN